MCKHDGDLISRSALLEKSYWHGDRPDVGNPYADGTAAVDVYDIEDAPAVDAVEVVRCKECKHNKESLALREGGIWCKYWGTDPDPNDFCSHGERRDGE